MFEFMHFYRGKKEVVLRTHDRKKAVEWARTYLDCFEQKPWHKHFLYENGNDVSINVYAGMHIEKTFEERREVVARVYRVDETAERRRERDHERYMEKKKCSM